MWGVGWKVSLSLLCFCFKIFLSQVIVENVFSLFSCSMCSLTSMIKHSSTRRAAVATRTPGRFLPGAAKLCTLSREAPIEAEGVGSMLENFKSQGTDNRLSRCWCTREAKVMWCESALTLLQCACVPCSWSCNKTSISHHQMPRYSQETMCRAARWWQVTILAGHTDVHVWCL